MRFIKLISWIGLAVLFLQPANISIAQDEMNSADDLEQDFWEFDDEDTSFMYKPNPNRVRLKAVITDQTIDRFGRGEPIFVNIPFGKEQVVSSLLIKRYECFKSAPLKIRVRSRIKGNDLVLEFPLDLIGRLDYQPVLVDVFQSNVNRCVIVPSLESSSVAPGIAKKIIDPDFYVRLKPDNGVAVAFKKGNGFKLTNEIVDADFPFNEIEGIFFNGSDSDDDRASIVMRNGDNISGQHHWPETIEFETPWGNERIELNQVVSVTRDRSTRLVPSGVSNPRWVIARDKR